MAFQLCEFQLFDNNGEPLSGGLVSVFNAGTTDEKDSYPTADDADAGTNANANPVVLDSAGRGQVWGKSGETYKIVIQTSAGVTLDMRDDITAPTNNPLKVYTAGGTANALTITLDPNPGAWSTGVSFYFRPVSANTGSATININGIGAKTLKLPDASTNLPPGYLQTSNVYGVWYDGTNAVVVSAPGVIESDNNANGYYVRFSDGTQECCVTGLADLAVTTAAGNIFISSTYTWTLPKAFLDTSFVVLGQSSLTNRWVVGSPASTTSATMRTISYASLGSAETVNLRAIGRWY